MALNQYLFFRWSYMLYQLVHYYASDLRKTSSLWEYIGTTVVIFQNAALLEVNKYLMTKMTF